MKRWFNLLLILVGFSANAQISYDFVEDLESRWLVNQDDKLVPFTDEDNPSLIYFQLASEDCTGCQLLIKNERKSTLYVDRKPVDILSPGFHFYSHDSIVATSGSDRLLLTVFNTNGGALSTYLVRDQIALERFRTSAEIFATPLKRNNEFGEFFLIAALTILIVFTVMKNLYPRMPIDFFSLSRTLSARSLDEVIFKLRFTEKYNLWLLALHGLIFSFLLLVFGHLTDGLFIEYLNVPASLTSALVKWIFISVFFMFLTTSLSILLSIMNGVFDFDFRAVHFYNHLRYSAIVGGILLLVAFISYQGLKIESASYYSSLVYIFLGLLLLRLFFIFQKLMTSRSNTILHLFSYLCATELIPFVIAVKVLFRG